MTKGIKQISVILDTAGMAYFLLYIIWVFLLGTEDILPGLTDFFNIINPYTTGGYVLGLIMLLHFSVQRGIVGKIIMAITFAVSFLLALPIMMVMQSNRDLLIYVPYLVKAIPTVVAAVYREYQSRKNRNVRYK